MIILLSALVVTSVFAKKPAMSFDKEGRAVYVEKSFSGEEFVNYASAAEIKREIKKCESGLENFKKLLNNPNISNGDRQIFEHQVNKAYPKLLQKLNDALKLVE